MKILGLHNHQLFQALVCLYFMLFVALLFSWNVFNTVNNDHVYVYEHQVFPTVKNNTTRILHMAVHNESTSPAFLNPVYIGGKYCSIRHVISFMGKPMLLSVEPVCSWLNSKSGFGNVIGYGHEFAHLRHVIINPSKASGKKGGENITAVWNQDEQDEYLKLTSGYFSLNCNKTLDYVFSNKNHLIEWKKAVVCDPKHDVNGLPRIKGFTIAVKRYEYVNLYHTMSDFYNAFLMMLIFNQNPDNITILWIDSHPSGSLDEPWRTLFSRTIRAGMLKEPTVFEDMVWNIMGYNSLLCDHYRPFTPYLEQFREFFLTRYGVSSAKTLDCNHLNVMFIWRRDYIAHPRNPSGKVKRKIENEDELIKTIQNAVPGHNVTGVQLDVLSMKQQLDLVAHTDILLGMHGAGLTHTLFLPKHGGLIEFYPTYWSQSNRHFRSMATWRGLQYQTWKNHDSSNEKAKYHTNIPPQIVLNMFLEAKSKLCKPDKR